MTQSMSHTQQQSPKTLESRHSIDSCLFQLRTWKPFTNKRPCLSDRKTPSVSIDLSKLSLLDDDSTSKPFKSSSAAATNFRLIDRKRRRRGSRSVSGRSSDRSGTHRCCSVGASAAHGTCSDFPVAMGTDSSGELFGNVGDANWASDVSEARRERDREGGGGGGGGGGNGGCGGEKESGVGFGGVGGCSDGNGNESGYGSEPGSLELPSYGWFLSVCTKWCTMFIHGIWLITNLMICLCSRY
ncbi:hypothetical protein PIB30_029763 [Stylosanthes scabra]|uniref:Uncharacterized protein n=1 Tax=Stylosanthes scabra TaxID=79078 RepID=A0ABU6RBM0_9FABA|nr:hypothetical protein [Stylosanthes scabra]